MTETKDNPNLMDYFGALLVVIGIIIVILYEIGVF